MRAQTERIHSVPGGRFDFTDTCAYGETMRGVKDGTAVAVAISCFSVSFQRPI